MVIIVMTAHPAQSTVVLVRVEEQTVAGAKRTWAFSPLSVAYWMDRELPPAPAFGRR